MLGHLGLGWKSIPLLSGPAEPTACLRRSAFLDAVGRHHCGEHKVRAFCPRLQQLSTCMGSGALTGHRGFGRASHGDRDFIQKGQGRWVSWTSSPPLRGVTRRALPTGFPAGCPPPWAEQGSKPWAGEGTVVLNPCAERVCPR